MDRTILFKVNSETDVQALVELNNTIIKRVRTLEALKVLPKAEVIDGRATETGVRDSSETADS